MIVINWHNCTRCRRISTQSLPDIKGCFHCTLTGHILGLFLSYDFVTCSIFNPLTSTVPVDLFQPRQYLYFLFNTLHSVDSCHHGTIFTFDLTIYTQLTVVTTALSFPLSLIFVQLLDTELSSCTINSHCFPYSCAIITDRSECQPSSMGMQPLSPVVSPTSDSREIAPSNTSTDMKSGIWSVRHEQ